MTSRPSAMRDWIFTIYVAIAVPLVVFGATWFGSR